MTRILDFGQDTSVMKDVMDLMDERGYSSEEAIPGLILAARLHADMTEAPEQALDEAANLLADGPIDEEVVK